MTLFQAIFSLPFENTVTSQGLPFLCDHSLKDVEEQV